MLAGGFSESYKLSLVTGLFPTCSSEIILFLQNFTESIAGEMSKHKVDVLITNPAAIEGEASSIYDQDKVPLQTLKAETVVEDSLQGLGRRTTTVPGLYNKLAVGAAGLAFSRDQLSFIGEKILERAAKPSAQQ